MKVTTNITKIIFMCLVNLKSPMFCLHILRIAVLKTGYQGQLSFVAHRPLVFKADLGLEDFHSYKGVLSPRSCRL